MKMLRMMKTRPPMKNLMKTRVIRKNGIKKMRMVLFRSLATDLECWFWLGKNESWWLAPSFAVLSPDLFAIVHGISKSFSSWVFNISSAVVSFAQECKENLKSHCPKRLQRKQNHITSHHITSHHITSHQIKSNQIKSNQIKEGFINSILLKWRFMMYLPVCSIQFYFILFCFVLFCFVLFHKYIQYIPTLTKYIFKFIKVPTRLIFAEQCPCWVKTKNKQNNNKNLEQPPDKIFFSLFVCFFSFFFLFVCLPLSFLILSQLALSLISPFGFIHSFSPFSNQIPQLNHGQSSSKQGTPPRSRQGCPTWQGSNPQFCRWCFGPC